MSHKTILNQLLTKEGVEVFSADSDIGITYRLESEKLVAYLFNPKRSVWIKRTMVNPLNIFSGKYNRYKQGQPITGNIEPVNEPSKFMLQITDKQVIEDLLLYKAIRIPGDEGNSVAYLERSHDRIAFMAEEQWQLKELYDYTINRNMRNSGRVTNNDIKQLLKGETLFVVHFYGSGSAFQFHGDVLVRYVLNNRNFTWTPAVSSAWEFFNSRIYNAISIPRIDMEYETSAEESFQLTDKEVLNLYLKTSSLYFRFKDGLGRVKNGTADFCDDIMPSNDDVVQIMTEEQLNIKTQYEQLQYHLLFDRSINILRLSQKQFLHRLNYFFNNHKDDRITFVFNSYYGLSGFKKLNLSQIAKELGKSPPIVSSILDKLFRRLRHPTNIAILQRGYVAKPGDLDLKIIDPPASEQHLSIDKMRYYAGCVAGIY